MDEEEHHVEVQREASGLLAVVFLVFLTGAALIVGLTLWPVLQSIPPTSPPAVNSK